MVSVSFVPRVGTITITSSIFTDNTFTSLLVLVLVMFLHRMIIIMIMIMIVVVVEFW